MVAFDAKSHWEAVYRNKSPLEVSWYQREPLMSLGLIERSGVAKDAPLIDVGGGASVLVDRLCELGYSRLAVLDVAGRALDLAKKRLGAKAAQVEWFEADVLDFTPPHAFALWHDRAVFHFLTRPSHRRAYVRRLDGSVAAGGQVIMGAFTLGGPKRCTGLDIVQYDAEGLLRELGEGFQLLEEAHELHTMPGGGEQDFAWFRLQKRR